jgi:hypothetical protein
MPAAHSIDDNAKLIATVWTGAITDLELSEALEQYHRQIREFDYLSYSQLLDFGEAERIQLTVAGIRHLAHLAVGTDVPGRKTKLAIVVDRPVAYGLARMYATYRGLVPGQSKEVAVFRERGKALKWLKGTGAAEEGADGTWWGTVARREDGS